MDQVKFGCGKFWLSKANLCPWCSRLSPLCQIQATNTSPLPNASYVIYKYFKLKFKTIDYFFKFFFITHKLTVGELNIHNCKRDYKTIN